ncbi:hypothetical protein GCM10027568_22230 [Humibacter soli]
MSVVIYPELTVRKESNGCLPGTKVLTVLRNKEMQALENKVIDPINNAARTVVRKWAPTPVRARDGNTLAVMVHGAVPKRLRHPLTHQAPPVVA